MPKLAVPLTDLQVKRAKPGDKLIKLFDGEGMYLEIHPNGGKFWRFRFRQRNGGVVGHAISPDAAVPLAQMRKVVAANAATRVMAGSSWLPAP